MGRAVLVNKISFRVRRRIKEVFIKLHTATLFLRSFFIFSVVKIRWIFNFA